MARSANLPTIDVERWRSGDDATKVAVAKEVDDALCTYGFLLLINHGIRSELPADLRREVRKFFALADREKAAIETRVGGRGWIPPGAESNAYASGVESPPDMKETFKLGYYPDDSPMANRWPRQVPGLRDRAESYLAQIWNLAREMFTLLDAALDLEPGTFTDHASPEESSLNLNWYPSLNALGPAQKGQFRIGAHSDFGMLTLLDRQSGYGGLQIQTIDGQWIDAPHVVNALTVNVGDLLAQWTGDRWRSTVHRVLPPSDRDPAEELLSLVSFIGVAPDTIVETLDVGGRQRYEPIRAGDYLRAKLKAIDTSPT